MRGGDLFSLLQRKGRFPEEKARVIFRRLACALLVCHRAGIHHLDVSLENVLLDEIEHPVLCDFGASRPASAQNGLHKASPARRCKRGYASPEMLDLQDFDGAKSDAFALGVVLYAMLTASLPFVEASLEDERYAFICVGRLHDMLAAQGFALSLEAADLLNRLLHHDPAQRVSVSAALSHPWLRFLPTSPAGRPRPRVLPAVHVGPRNSRHAAAPSRRRSSCEHHASELKQFVDPSRPAQGAECSPVRLPRLPGVSLPSWFGEEGEAEAAPLPGVGDGKTPGRGAVDPHSLDDVEEDVESPCVRPRPSAAGGSPFRASSVS